MTTFWKGKKVLLTGHTGFKGSWLSLVLQMLGAETVGFALAPATKPNLFEVASVEKGMTSIIGNICDYDHVLATFQQYQPEIVIHMAAQPLVRYSYKAPIETYATNVLGSVHVMEAARHSGSVKAFVNVTTDKCYENKEWHWSYRENDALGGHDPYSNSKACAELVTQCYRDSFFKAEGIGLASARAGNVIGGGDWAEDRLIPDIIRAMQHHSTLSIRNPNALRPWQHVLEPLSGYLLLAEKLYNEPEAFNSAWNFGPNRDDIQTVRWIVDFLKGQWEHTPDKKLHEAMHLALDCSKAKAMLGWEPRWNLETGLQCTLNWYQAFYANKNMREFTEAQIQEFFSFRSNFVNNEAFSTESL